MYASTASDEFRARAGRGRSSGISFVPLRSGVLNPAVADGAGVALVAEVAEVGSGDFRVAGVIPDPYPYGLSRTGALPTAWIFGPHDRRNPTQTPPRPARPPNA